MNTSNTSAVKPQTEDKRSDSEIIEEACTGKFRGVLREYAADLQRYFGMTLDQRIKAIRSLSTDLGRIQATEAGIKLGKLNKDRMLSIREVAKAIKTHLTPSLALLKACNILTELGMYHVRTQDKELSFTETIRSWLDSK